MEFDAERRELFHFWRVGAKEQFELFARCAERGLDERLVGRIAKHAPQILIDERTVCTCVRNDFVCFHSGSFPSNYDTRKPRQLGGILARLVGGRVLLQDYLAEIILERRRASVDEGMRARLGRIGQNRNLVDGIGMRCN